MRRLNEKMNQMLSAGYVRGIRMKKGRIEALKQAMSAMKLYAGKSGILTDNRGEGYIDTAIVILISVVLGALLLAGLYALFGDVVLFS